MQLALISNVVGVSGWLAGFALEVIDCGLGASNLYSASRGFGYRDPRWNCSTDS